MRLGWLFFGDKDNVLVDELMKAHNIEKKHKETVKKNFEEMLSKLEKDLKDEVEA